LRDETGVVSTRLKGAIYVDWIEKNVKLQYDDGDRSMSPASNGHGMGQIAEAPWRD
jgi:hypothetical protein